MTFFEVKTACDDFRDLMLASTGRSCIHAVTVEEPSGDEDELHFVRLVLWCYVFWFEACHPVGNHIASLLKAGSPSDYKKVDEPFRVVRNLRTATAHNLEPRSKENDRTAQQARIWLTVTGGEPRDWCRCCSTLCEDVKRAVELLHKTWDSLIQNPEDAKSGLERLILALTRDWPAHAFDRMLEQAAYSVRLTGFDLVAYRAKRLETWRSLAAFFDDRDNAEAALQRAIRQELIDLFGQHAPQGPPQSQGRPARPP